MRLLRACALILPTLAAGPALAHGGHAEGLVDGLTHPLLGVDHLVAMLAIGAWAALGGMRRAWTLPVAFLAAMGAGIGLGLTVTLPAGIEQGVVATAVALVLAAGLALPCRAVIALPLAVLSGLLHGAVHGAEIGGAAAATVFGMLVASAALHAVGFAAGWAVVTRRAAIARTATAGR